MNEYINNFINRYFEIMEIFPEQFKKTAKLQIILDREQMTRFYQENGRAIGVVYESPYHLIVVDLLRSESGKYFTYLRILSPNGSKNGVVMIPFYEDRIALLKQFRHGTRDWEWELPRGFAEKDITPLQNAEKEIEEELGTRALSVQHEGSIISDSGLSGGAVEIFSVGISGYGKLATDEGIESVKWVSILEIKRMIKSNEIRDAFTICAITKYLLNREG